MWMILGSLSGALAVAAGAFGAHALNERLDPKALELWDTGSRYLMYSALATILAAIALAEPLQSGVRSAAWPPAALCVGGWIFAGTLFVMALGGPRWLGAVTPLGGLSLILGFVLLAWRATS